LGKGKEKRTSARTETSTISGAALRYASDRLRNDRKIVLEAVKNNRSDQYLLECVPPELRDDEEIMLEMMKNRGKNAWYLLRYASERLRNDPEFLRKAREILGERF
jgi:hypothetical protein